ncbi:hypothetical protein R2Q81_09695 [Microbacterium aquimaris]|nr:hypothetical protein [Microbacterium aquimaris]MDZ8276216.1 hypothetical protein [Microbacterium aquimaris]
MSRATTVLARSLGVLIVTAALAGCSPTPEPTPTPTGFASEEEAFAAAEATYRAYVAATNAQREDPAYSPAPESFLRGEALQDEIRASQYLADLGVSVVGDTTVVRVDQVTSADNDVTLDVCVDSSRTRILNEEGTDVTPDRETPTLIRVQLVLAGDMFITSSATAKTGSC